MSQICRRSMLALIFLAAGQPLMAQNGGIAVGPAHALLPGVSEGELLLGELGCVACHSASEVVKARLAGRISPVLGPDGLSLTPQFIRAYLSDPAKEKPGTTMPDMLAALSDQERSESVEALVNYLVSVAPSPTGTNSNGDSTKIAQGRELFHTIGCVACHAPEVAKGGADAEVVSHLKRESVPFPNLANKMTVDELSKFLLNPVKYRHSGRMPSMNLSEREAKVLAVYLLRDQFTAISNPALAMKKMPGLACQYYEAAHLQQVGDLDKLAALNETSSDRIVLPQKHRNDEFGLRFHGLIHAEKAGEYSFFLTSDDGSRLYIDGKLVVDNDGVHPSKEVHGEVQLEFGDHDFMLLYFNAAGDRELRVAWKRPGAQISGIPAGVLFHSEEKMEPLGGDNFVVDAAKSAKGKELFSSLGCAACHDLGQPATGTFANAKPLLELNQNQGCLADKPSANAARYALSRDQLEALRETLKNKQVLARPLDPKAEAAYTLTRLNCIACHARDGIGGPSAGRSPYFTTVGEVDLGDEGRIPPHLNGVGNKLRPEWLQGVLLNKAVARPYMATRMPQFGSNNVSQLVSVFARADGPLKDEPPLVTADLKQGRKLVGTGGMACITCHTFGGHKSLGVPAMDLALMSKRLHSDWFARYVVNPAALRPGTRMPSFWPGGKSVRTDLLEGDTTRQIGAIWAYLSSTKDVGMPEGLVQGKMELVADKEAIIYRNFITGSPRSIGVGYPEKANLSWDANEMRLVSIWQGSFIDAAQQRSGRGEGFVSALGYNVVQFPAGSPLAILDKPDQKWPAASGKAAGYQMKGYVLDDVRRPAFHYDFSGIQVMDSFLAKGADTDAYFLRTLTFKGPKPTGNLWFRAWSGASAALKPDGSYLLEGKIKMKFTNNSGTPLIRQNEGQSELLVPVNLASGEAKIIQEIVW